MSQQCYLGGVQEVAHHGRTAGYLAPFQAVNRILRHYLVLHGCHQHALEDTEVMVNTHTRQ